MYILNPKIKIPLYIQLYEELKKDIIKNYTIGQKIPSIRKIASTYNISKNTIESAFSQLVVEGYIDSNPKSSYIVTDIKTNNFEIKDDNKLEIKREKEEVLYDFFPARLEKESFPLKQWKRLFTKVIDNSIDLGAYSNNQGELGLRIQIAKYLNSSRAVKCKPSQIILGNGFADSMGLLAMMLNKTNTIIATEDPGYHVLRKVFENHKYTIDKIPVDKNGIILEELEKTKSKLLYITPSHQYPTGVTIPISNRNQLLKWAEKQNTYIIEDDYDSELSYYNRPIPSLQGLDDNQRVIYIGTFSKALSPAIRISYMVLPSPLLEIFNDKFSYHGSRVCLMTQKTLEKFMQDGYWDKHLRKIRTQNKKKHNLMIKLLEEKLQDTMKIETQGGGLAILINPRVALNWEELDILAKKEKMNLYYAKQRCGDNWQALMMGFGSFKEADIEKAIDIFAKLWFKCLLQKIENKG